MLSGTRSTCAPANVDSLALVITERRTTVNLGARFAVGRACFATYEPRRPTDRERYRSGPRGSAVRTASASRSCPDRRSTLAPWPPTSSTPRRQFSGKQTSLNCDHAFHRAAVLRVCMDIAKRPLRVKKRSVLLQARILTYLPNVKVWKDSPTDRPHIHSVGHQ